MGDEQELLDELAVHIKSGDDTQLWDLACDWVSHDPTRARRTDLIKLPGMRLGVRPHQLFAACSFLFYTYAGENKFAGHIVGYDTSVGKTAAALLVAVLIRLSNLCRRHVLNEWAQCSTDANLPRSHLPRNQYDMDGSIEPADPERTCPSGKPFGIACFCVPGSMTRHNTGGDVAISAGPSLFLVPASVVRNWRKGAKQFVEGKFLLPPDVYGRREPIDFIEWSVSHGQDYIIPNKVLDDVRPAFDQPGPEYRMSSSNKKGRDKIGQSDVTYKLRHRNSDGPELNSFPKHQAIIVSSSPAGLNATGAKLLLETSVRIIGIRNGQTEKFVKFKWAIRPSLVVGDKFHEVKNLATSLATALRLIQRHAPKNQVPKIMPLSATPLTGTDMKKCLNLVTRLVLPEAWDHEPKGSPCYKLSHEDLIDRLVRGYQTLTVEMANASEPDLLERRNGVRKQLVERLRSIMTIRSGTDLFFGEQTILLPPLIKECASEDGVLVCQSLRAAAPDFAAKLSAQRRSAVLPAAGSGHHGQPSASQDLYKMALDADFLWRLRLGNFPGIIDLGCPRIYSELQQRAKLALGQLALVGRRRRTRDESLWPTHRYDLQGLGEKSRSWRSSWNLP